ncbi:trifunctional histidinol dehydrogenase [Ophidiomyces ophidiicola]|uniref:Trifunctional histidinol dehydrogenase n=1 Tax=Ophidiomyces ophidiicola TaxID=1387563 RepID=A0ACB8V5S3_9EURO|nr:trifunctional histidinol dehydrogenase [Ophidiomyces ophidiicola]KAI1947184.1 trifunctional histidinol dehydrogenase [Ophidiomyces ophidiicola]KAI1955700.1 trifunctional histidinol dehydrogenase [Ophidiomyces ophidiicola]KAI2011357.1 trifunctional histidinol dehydrogenase [Ophidiomyces ophidiicola]KAI2041721.1 trifunctional histidinol dehydrogenase [Ophidiomyces ophidiicola]KAI2060220.1 trifunctional histidinol dehydrogenase [Ophidiomyces ophidiicola]
MSLPFLISVDANSISQPLSCGLTLSQISYFGRVLLNYPSLDQALSFINANFAAFEIFVDATAIKSSGDVVNILNAGASAAFVTLDQLAALFEEQNIPPSRIVAYVSSTDDVARLKNWISNNNERREISVHIHNSTAIDAVLSDLKDDSLVKAVYRPSDNATIQSSLLLNEQERVISVVPSVSLALGDEANSIVKMLVTGAVPDSHTGLYATIVTDERGVALGLVWSSEKSISEAIKTGTGVYQSRKRGLWYKGQSSGDVQELVKIGLDCDSDCLVFTVRQKGRGLLLPNRSPSLTILTFGLGFCHLGTASCFGTYSGLARLQKTLQARKEDVPPGSYTSRLFNDPKLLNAKIMEEADELCTASTKEEIAFEAADLFYFALTKCIAAGVKLEDVEKNLDLKSLKVKRRKGDAKTIWAEKTGVSTPKTTEKASDTLNGNPSASLAGRRIQMRRLATASTSPTDIQDALQRPSQKSNEAIVSLVTPIIQDVRANGDSAILKYTHQFEKATSLTSPVIRAPFSKELMILSPETKSAIDTSFENIQRFHSAQKEQKPLEVETMPGVVCSRFVRPIERVGLYIPGGTAVLPSTALMLGVPAMVAGCKKIVMASPPRSDGSISPEIVYIAHKVGAESIVLAGGAQAVAAMAYGTPSVSKVDKILGPGNQFVTAAKMLVSNDTSAGVSIDMPAGPSEVLVIADRHANPAFVASDLLSQAEHGVDSQVILIAVDLDDARLSAIEEELHEQAIKLPRVDIVRGSIEHSVTFIVKDLEEAFALSNAYAPEHLILQIRNASDTLSLVENAGSVFIGQWTPESVGDYSAGVNHSLPTYGYAKQYSGVNLASFVKHITSSNLTAEGLRNVSQSVMQLASVEGLDAHRQAVSIRVDWMNRNP